MKVINMGRSTSVMNQFVAELRDVNVQKDRMRFRRNLERIGEIQAYEISKQLPFAERVVKTPLGEANMVLPREQVVVGTVFRAGLPHHQGFLNVFDGADNAFVSAFRYYKDKAQRQVDVHIEYIVTPDLNGRILLLVDPMLATGGSLELALEALVTRGTPSQIHLACIIASQQGVDHLTQRYADRDDITLWCAAIDPTLNEFSYIVPGLGDAGDLAFGEKLSNR